MSSTALDSNLPRPPSRLIAALLSLLAPGVGHLYAGAQRRGLVVILGSLALSAAMLGGAFLMRPTFNALALSGILVLAALAAVYLFAIIDAARLAGHADAAPRMPWYLLIAAILGLWAAHWAMSASVKRQIPWRTFSVASTSMQPTLRIGEYLLADTKYYATHQPARGEVALYLLPSDNTTIFIKRIVAVAGDRIAFREGRAVVNGVMTAEPFADFGDPKSFLANIAEVTVPADHFFAAGDNRANSSDSRARQHGMVPTKNLVARATEIFLSDDAGRMGLWVGTPAK